MAKKRFVILFFLCLVNLVSFEGLTSEGSEIPWPMSSYDAAGTGCSPYVGIDSPWLIPLLTEEEISDKAGVGLKLTDDFLLIGKDGILFLSATPYEGGHTGPGKVMVAIDPTGPGVLWTTPIERSGSPAIGPDGTVYIYTVDPDNIAAEHHLVGLDPYTGDVVWQPTCKECVPQPYIPTMCEAGTYHPYPAHPDILIGPQGYLYACYRGCFVVFGPAPDRPVIRPWGAVFANVAFGARPVIGPDGTFYFLSLGDSGGYAVKAVAPDGTERWNTFISQYPQLSIEEQLHMVAGERAVYVLVGEEGGNPRVVALNRERGNILWTQELVGQCGTPFVKFSRPVLGPSGLLYVLLSRADGEWLVVLVTQNGGEPYWVRVGDAVPPYAGRTNYSLLLAADDTLLVEAKQALVQIDGQTGEISSCIVSVPISVGSMAMASDGTVYTAGGGSHDVLMTVPNEPPRILSFQYSVESADENRARVRFEGVIEDPLGWNRSVILNWDYGDGSTHCNLPRRLPEEHGTYSTSFDSYHTYDLNATVSVELTVSVEGCSQIFATSEALVCLEPPTIELAEATPGNVYAEETEVIFTCQAVPPGAQARQTLVYAWNFGDGESETVQTASHCYADSGEYTATVTVNVEDQLFQASQTVTVEVAGPPTLSISTTPNLVQPTDDGIKLDFTCQVEDPFGQEPSSFSWDWDFGDGETSFERSPSHIFQARGTYTASVTVELPGGEKFDTDFQVCAQSPVISALTAWPSPAYAGTPIEFSCSVPGCAGQAALYSWNFGDGATQSGDDLSTLSHQYDAAGTTYTVEVTVGTSPLDATESTVLTVHERPQQLTAIANAEPSSGAFPLTVEFTGVAAAPEGSSVTGYTWNFGDGTSSSEQNPTHTYSADGSYEATLTVTAGLETDEARVFIRPDGFTEITLDCLKITADQADTQDGVTTYSGNVVLNDFLNVGGSLSDDGSLTGSGGLTIQNNDYPIPFPSSFAIGDEAQDEDDNCYRLITITDVSNPPSDFTFDLYGFGLTLEWPRLYEDRLFLEGTINPYGDWAFALGFSLTDHGIDLAARVDIDGFTIAGLEFSDVYVEADTYANTWGGGAMLAIPNYFTVGVAVGFAGTSLDDIHISVEDFSVPIGGPPPVIYLTGVSGGLDNLASDDPLIISLGASLSAGPSISFAGGDYSLLAGDVAITIDLSGRFTAAGTLYLISESIGKIGAGEIVFDLNDGLYVSGTLYYPPVASFITATGQGKVGFDLNFQARLDGKLSAPSDWWLIGGMTFAQAAVYVDNDLISAGVALGQEVCCCWHCLDLTIDVSVTVDFASGDVEVAKNWDHIQEVTFSTFDDETTACGGIRSTGMARTGNASCSTGPFIECAFGPPSANRPNTVFADTTGGHGQDLEDHTFDIPADLGVVIFRVVGDPSFTLTDPNGDDYDQTQASSPSSFTEPVQSGSNILVELQTSKEPAFILWRSNDVISELWCAVQRPCTGQWTVRCNSKAQVEALRPNQKPTLTMLEPREGLTVEAGDKVTIEWKAADEDSDPTVRLCYTKSPSHDDHGKPVLPGSTITTGLQEEENKWEWDTAGIAPGRYYIYGVTTDDKNFPVFAWSSGSVTVQRSDFPPPENVVAKQEGSVVQVEWDPVSGAAGYSIYYQDVQETAPLVLATSQAVWEDTTTVLQHLEPGVTYRIAVTAFTEDGLKSDYSEIIEVTVGGK